MLWNQKRITKREHAAEKILKVYEKYFPSVFGAAPRKRELGIFPKIVCGLGEGQETKNKK